MAWRIEQAKSDRSTCRFCSKKIDKGEYRFGNDDLNAFWYHLACAPEGKPRAFKPFAARAAKLAPAAKSSAKPVAAGGARDAGLEAKLLADPSDRTTLAVFADWLQTNGDPWGELIALELAGKKKDAKRLLKTQADSLTGGFGARGLEWKRGFIDRIETPVSLKGAKASLPGLLGLRTALLATELVVPVSPDAELIGIISAHAPKALESMFVWLAPAVAELAVPSLESLTLMIQRDRPVAPAALAPLLSGERLPKLRELAFFQAPLSVELLRALLDSKLFAQLESLGLYQNALSPEGAELLLSRKHDLARLKALDLGRQSSAALNKAFGAQIEEADRLREEEYGSDDDD